MVLVVRSCRVMVLVVVISIDLVFWYMMMVAVDDGDDRYGSAFCRN